MTGAGIEEMIKAISMMKRKEGLTLEGFKRYWCEQHTLLVKNKTPEGVAPNEIVHNWAVTFGGGWEQAFDGIESLCFSNLERYLEWREWLRSKEAQILREDELNFVDPVSRVALVVEEKVVVPERKVPGGGRARRTSDAPVKLMAMLKRKQGMKPEEFSRYWYEEHGPLAVKVIPETVAIRRYVQNHAVRLGKEDEPLVDGIVEFLLEDMDSLDAWMSFYGSDEGKVIREDEVKFIDVNDMMVVMVEERVLR